MIRLLLVRFVLTRNLLDTDDVWEVFQLRIDTASDADRDVSYRQ